ncbi:MAG TPA: HAMP domain-containing sensor histidine kinase [Candidatus Saccharimonadales bacterium]|jgi:signal transduction histidine kinase
MEDKKSKDQHGLLGTVSRFSPREFRRITREMYSQNLELAQVNKTLSLLNTVDLVVLQSDNSMDAVCTKITNAIVNDYGTCAFAAIFCMPQRRDAAETLAAWACDWLPDADRPEVSRLIKSFAPDTSYNWSVARGVLLTTDISVVSRVLSAEQGALEAFIGQMHLDHFYIARLAGSRGVIGTLVMGRREENAKRDKELLSRVSEAISMALDNKLLQAENEKILLRLRKTNEKLRLLDETKDDFISMASHQLRTPLTAVKGYISLVLDGDAGEVKPQQRKLLTQAFTSSQRMVYLIADLLNVSRLKTGKFLIEPTPVNLADIVQDEVDQLIETAKGRQLALTYRKPAHFPVLELDETKIRQVVMNFIDNAIYYTPPGGSIDVSLIETEKSIELRVVDDGIGVPKAERYHLFTKFYRAKNAQKARPDGTGLGLFMAQKVVVAQGGAIIFNSQENKGSTFGFTFPKARLAPTNITHQPTLQSTDAA